MAGGGMNGYWNPDPNAKRKHNKKDRGSQGIWN
jgi:hypothetical protein